MNMERFSPTALPMAALLRFSIDLTRHGRHGLTGGHTYLLVRESEVCEVLFSLFSVYHG